MAAWLRRRPRRDLYHAALEVHLPETSYVIEQTPAARDGGRHGAVATGAVGARRAGRLRIFRYEIRRWPGGRIPDARFAVDSPRRLSDDPERARAVLAATERVPTPVWGRDELGTGEMWNSNSVIAWVLAGGGIDAAAIKPPPGGRAPGWSAGVTIARRGREGGTAAV